MWSRINHNDIVKVTPLPTALEMKVKKKELTQSEAELGKTMETVAKLQKRLQEAEKLLVRWTNDNETFYNIVQEGSLYQAKELLKSAEQANKSK